MKKDEIAPASMAVYDDLLNSLTALGGRLTEIHQEAVAQYTPVVEDILRSGSRDVRAIEQALDGLLDFSRFRSGPATLSPSLSPLLLHQPGCRRRIRPRLSRDVGFRAGIGHGEPGMSTKVKSGYRQTEVGMIPEDRDVKPLHALADKIMVGIASAATHAYRDSRHCDVPKPEHQTRLS